MSTRRPLGTGPEDDRTRRISASEADLQTTLPGLHLPDVADLRARGLLPVERIVGDEHQEHEHAPARGAGGPVPGRRPLGHRGQ